MVGQSIQFSRWPNHRSGNAWEDRRAAPTRLLRKAGDGVRLSEHPDGCGPDRVPPHQRHRDLKASYRRGRYTVGRNAFALMAASGAGTKVVLYLPCAHRYWVAADTPIL